MMEEVQEQKFVCKFCSKCCFSGKSLGGHMRCHLALISAAKKEKVKADINFDFGEDDDHGDSGLEDNPKKSCRASAEQSNSSLVQENVENHSSSKNLENNDHEQDQENYGLRENPKKSRKISDLGAFPAPRKANLCKECGKNFPSLRALAGHMRTHSGKFRDRHLCEKCGKGFDSMRAMYGHMKSHSTKSRVFSESADGVSDFDIVYPRKKRSAIRYRFSQNFSFSTANASSSVNEIDELEDAAICLIMLSRAVRKWDGVNGPLEYADNSNSTDFEAKSFALQKGKTKIDDDDDDVVRDLDEIEMKEKPIEELYSCFSGSDKSFSNQNVSQLNDLGSEFACGNENKSESEVCVDKPLGRGEFKKSRLVDVSGIKLDDQMIKRTSDSAGVVELLKDQSEKVGMEQKDLQSEDPNPRKKVKFSGHDPELDGSSSDVAKCDETAAEIFKDPEKKSEYKCKTCNMIFSSHHALGGHRNRHKMDGPCSSLSTGNSHLTYVECNDASTEGGSGKVAMAGFELTKSKDHECTICFKAFSTGQALGGHKRAHYVSFGENRTKEMTVVNQELHDIQDVFDLNLPVNTPLGARGDVASLKKWWVGTGHEPEPLVISN